MRRRLLNIVGLAMVLTTGWQPASAQPKAEALLLPVELPGYYTPINSDQLTQRLTTRLAQLAKKANIQMARRAELTASKYTPGSEQPPSTQMAGDLCRAYKANFLCWASIRFQPNYDAASHSLAMAGAAHIWVYSQADGRAVIDQPLSLIRSAPVANIKDQAASLKVAHELAAGCTDDLGLQLVYIAQQRKAQLVTQQQMSQWKPAPSAPATQSKNYKDMVNAIGVYQRATSNQNFIDVTQSQQTMSNLWLRLNKSEQDAISTNYPGVVRLLEAPPINGYWPYYYGY